MANKITNVFKHFLSLRLFDVAKIMLENGWNFNIKCMKVAKVKIQYRKHLKIKGHDIRE